MYAADMEVCLIFIPVREKYAAITAEEAAQLSALSVTAEENSYAEAVPAAERLPVPAAGAAAMRSAQPAKAAVLPFAPPAAIPVLFPVRNAGGKGPRMAPEASSFW